MDFYCLSNFILQSIKELFVDKQAITYEPQSLEAEALRLILMFFISLFK